MTRIPVPSVSGKQDFLLSEVVATVLVPEGQERGTSVGRSFWATASA